MSPPVKIAVRCLLVLLPVLLVGLAMRALPGQGRAPAPVDHALPPMPGIAPAETAQQAQDRVAASSAELTQQFAVNGGQGGSADAHAVPVGTPATTPGQPMLDPQPALDPTPPGDRAASAPAPVAASVAANPTLAIAASVQ